MAGLDHIFGYSALIPGDYSDLLQTNEIGDNPWRETMANNAILSLLNTRFIFATQEQWKSLQNILAEASPATSDAAPPGSGRENLLSPSAWIALSGSPANLRCAVRLFWASVRDEAARSAAGERQRL